MGTVQIIQALGERVDALWREAERRPDAFSDIAESCLIESGLLLEGDHREVARWLLSPHSNDIVQDGYGFGEPSIIVYRTKDFFIQLLYWLDGSPNIHEHGFEGVFGVLHGSSIHSRYDFHSDRAAPIANGVEFGKVQCTGVELLRRGDCRPIRSSGNAHALFHLDYPSVSVVVRNFWTAEKKPQRYFIRPHLAIDPDYSSQADLTRLLTLQMLAQTRLADFRAELPRALAKSGDWFKLNFFRWLLNFQDDLGLRILKYSGVQLSATEMRILASAMVERRTNRILMARQAVRRPDHRCFLAFLSNVNNRDQLMSLVGQQFPDADPVEQVTQWITEIFHEPKAGIAMEPGQIAGIERYLRSQKLEGAGNCTDPPMDEPSLASCAAGIFEPLFR